MRFLKLVMIVLPEIYVAGKIFGKICLKAIRDTFFPICGLQSGKARGTGGDIQQTEKVQTLVLQGDPLPQVSPFVWHPNLSIKKILKSDWSTYSNDFEKSEWEYFLSKQQIYNI